MYRDRSRRVERRPPVAQPPSCSYRRKPAPRARLPGAGPCLLATVAKLGIPVTRLVRDLQRGWSTQARRPGAFASGWMTLVVVRGTETRRSQRIGSSRYRPLIGPWIGRPGPREADAPGQGRSGLPNPQRQGRVGWIARGRIPPEGDSGRTPATDRRLFEAAAQCPDLRGGSGRIADCGGHPSGRLRLALRS